MVDCSSERSGVGYAIASDLGDDASAELALAAAPAREIARHSTQRRTAFARVGGGRDAQRAGRFAVDGDHLNGAVVGPEAHRLTRFSRSCTPRLRHVFIDFDDRRKCSSVGVCTRGRATQSVTGSANTIAREQGLRHAGRDAQPTRPPTASTGSP